MTAPRQSPILRLVIELEIDESITGPVSALDAEEWQSFIDDILCDPDGLLLHSNVLGDTVGRVALIRIEGES